jgi:protein-S-isoprenylcysteine O-methyltransferase Ste14
MTIATTPAIESPGAVRAAAALAYATICYLVFFATFLAFVAFVGGVLPPAVDGRMAPWEAAIVDAALVVGFGLQHSIMARQGFKRMWTRVVPAPVERSTYVLAASIMLGSLVALWQPLPGAVWAVESTTGAASLWAVFAFGWATVLFTTFLIDHFELFGLRQAWTYATGRRIPEARFKTPNVYRLVRHPMQLGFVIAFWAAPVMTIDRLVLAALLTAYIVTALVFEERDLVAAFGDEYRAYQNRVPKLLPKLWPR